MSPLTLQEFSPTFNEGIDIFLHNNQRLSKHYEDRRKDICFKDVDVMCLTPLTFLTFQLMIDKKIFFENIFRTIH